jgi:uncharacterized membrane protein HdeD (DUF308 family)
MEASFERNTEPAVLAHHWWAYVALGIAMIVMGTIAIVTPLAAAVAINALVGAALLVGGVVQLVYTFLRHKSVGKVVLGLIVGALYVIAGLILLGHPFAAILSLTLFLAGFFVVAGVFKIIGSIEAHGLPHWVWGLVGGVLTFILGVLIWAGWPSSAIWAIGLIVGIDLLFMGWTAIAVGLASHAAWEAGAGRLAGQH